MVTGEFDVFVSYGHDDQPWVQVLAENLERAGLHVFYDEWEILAGDRLVHRLDAGIRGSANGIVVVSPHAISRPWVAEEYGAMLTRAVDGRQRLIPVLLADAELPPFLAARVWVDFRHTHDPVGYTAKVTELVAALRGRRPARPAADGTVRPPPGLAFRAEGPRQATLRIGPDWVALATADGTAGGRPAGLDWSAGEALRELERVRIRRTATSGVPLKAPADGAAVADSVDGALRAVGRMLGERLLPVDVAAGLAREVDAAKRGGVPLRLAIETDVDRSAPTAAEGGTGLADLPWETLTLPGQARPLVLHPCVQLHRAVSGLGPTPAAGIRGPLRILAVIASPERGGGQLLDYEAELGRILDAVEPARRQGRAYVRILNWGSRAAIRAALLQERFHILHLSCHAQPGGLLLETDDGDADLVDTEMFAEQVLVPGRGVPLVVLAGCSTALTTPSHLPAGQHAAEQGEQLLPGLARGLLAHGVPAVVAMTAPVTDLYATEVTSRLYAELASRADVDPLAALADARRAIETQRVGLPAGDRKAVLAEWATLALFLRGPVIPLFDPDGGFEEVVEPVVPVLARGIVSRRVGEFVGRRGELRNLLRTLRGEHAGVVLHGLGGVGKSTLAAQLIAALGEQAGLVISVTGPIAVDQILATLASRLASWCLAHNIDETDMRRRLVDVLRSGRTGWQQRLDLIADLLLPTLPVTLLLDNAEDNLTPAGPCGGQTFTDPQLGVFLAAWTSLPGRAKLLATSRYPLPADRETAGRLHTHHLGPLSVAEARKLLWRLPALDSLPADQQARAIANVGGHPRTLEYLDALLSGGQARFPDIAARLEAVLRVRGINNPAAWYTTTADLDRALAETITLAVDDILLDRLLVRLSRVPHARRLLAGAAAYRLPVDQVGLAWQIAQQVEPTTNPEPDRQAQLTEITHLLSQTRAADATSLQEAGLTAEQIDVYRDRLDRQRHLPLDVPDGYDHAVAALLNLGLLTPTAGGDGQQTAFTVHRWTATAILQRTNPRERTDAHRCAAAYWQWRVAVWPQDQLTDVTQLIEAGYHQLHAGQYDALWSTTYAACQQLHTWGLWDWEEHTCQHTVTHLPSGSRLSAAFTDQLGRLAAARGDNAAAEQRYHQALAIKEKLGDRAGIATSYHQLGSLARARGEYHEAEQCFLQSLAIRDELGDRAGIARIQGALGSLAQGAGDNAGAEQRYHQALTVFEALGDRDGVATYHDGLGMIAQRRGDYAAAEQHYHQALTIKEELGDRAGVATSYYYLGTLAEARGDYAAAEQRYHQWLTIKEELGDRAAIVAYHGQLGSLAEKRGDYTAAEQRYHQALTIAEELGDRDSIANSACRLGVLHTVQGQAADAVPFNLKSLAIRFQIGNPQQSIDLNWLSRQREILGDATFQTIIADHLSPGDDLLNLLNTPYHVFPIDQFASESDALLWVINFIAGEYGNRDSDSG